MSCAQCIYKRPFVHREPWKCGTCGFVYGVPCVPPEIANDGAFTSAQELRAAELLAGDVEPTPHDLVGYWSWVAGRNMGHLLDDAWSGWLAAEMGWEP